MSGLSAQYRRFCNTIPSFVWPLATQQTDKMAPSSTIVCFNFTLLFGLITSRNYRPRLLVKYCSVPKHSINPIPCNSFSLLSTVLHHHRHHHHHRRRRCGHSNCKQASCREKILLFLEFRGKCHFVNLGTDVTLPSFITMGNFASIHTVQFDTMQLSLP